MGLSAAGWIAIGAACAAVLALGIAVYPFVQIRRLRANQVVLLAVSLQALMDDLHGAVSEVAAALSRVDRRVDGSVTNTSLVRYDAYEGAGGHQSASIALLDANRSGIIVTAIQGRDYARIYVKELDRGQPNVGLSPEEQQAVEKAMAG